jgi:hypothetical protein
VFLGKVDGINFKVKIVSLQFINSIKHSLIQLLTSKIPQIIMRMLGGYCARLFFAVHLLKRPSKPFLTSYGVLKIINTLYKYSGTDLIRLI